MSYARPNEGDVYVIGIKMPDGGPQALECCGCIMLENEYFCAHTAQAMLDHLRQHVVAGHAVPARAITALQDEIEGREEPWCDADRARRLPANKTPVWMPLYQQGWTLMVADEDGVCRFCAGMICNTDERTRDDAPGPFTWHVFRDLRGEPLADSIEGESPDLPSARRDALAALIAVSK